MQIEHMNTIVCKQAHIVKKTVLKM